MRIISLLLAVLLTTAGSSPASEPALKEVVATLEAGYADLRDLQAAFSQSTTLVGIPKAQKGHGELALRRPSGSAAQFRFDYAVPKQQIISNGKQVWFYQPDSRQVIVSSMDGMFKGKNSIAMAYLTGLGDVSKDFTAALAKEPKDKKGNFLLELTPLKPSPMLAKLRLTIDAAAVERYRTSGKLTDTFPILVSVVIDSSGNTTRIEYSKTRINSGLGPAKFNFKVPEGTEIIKP